MLRNVVTQFDRARVETMVISLTTRSPIGDELASLGIPVIALGGRGGVLTPRQLKVVANATASWRPDVVHSWMYHSNVVAQGLSCFPRRPRIACITSVRGSLDAPEQQPLSLRFVRRLDAVLSTRADAIVFNSAASARQHAAIGYDARRITVIPNGFDTTVFAPSESSRHAVREELGCGSNLVIGLVGRFDPLKGHRIFLEAAHLVAKQQAGCKFLLVGRGCDRSNSVLTGWIRQFRLDAQTILLGERRDIATIDVIVSSSISESFPNAVGEAMSVGVPAVVTDVGDCASLVGDTGVIVPPRNSVALSEGIMRLLRHGTAACRAIGARARERISAHYSLPVVAERYVALYEGCVLRR